MESPRGANLRIPPPAFFAVGLLLALLLDAATVSIPIAGANMSVRTLARVGWLLVTLAAGLAFWGVATFRIARTPVIPFSPTTTLVRSGPYRFTRNPMYLGMTVAYVGFAFVLNTAWPFLLLPLVMLGMHWFVIRVEEAYLSDLFGADYREYRKRVRRWI